MHASMQSGWDVSCHTCRLNSLHFYSACVPVHAREIYTVLGALTSVYTRSRPCTRHAGESAGEAGSAHALKGLEPGDPGTGVENRGFATAERGGP